MNAFVGLAVLTLSQTAAHASCGSSSCPIDVAGLEVAKPGRLSHAEPLVHTFGNWVLDHVLGVTS